jgi:hypothetical protein
MEGVRDRADDRWPLFYESAVSIRVQDKKSATGRINVSGTVILHVLPLSSPEKGMVQKVGLRIFQTVIYIPGKISGYPKDDGRL